MSESKSASSGRVRFGPAEETPRVGRGIGRWVSALVIGLAVGTLAPSARAASFPPEQHFRSLVLPHITLHYHQGLEPMARLAAALAEEILVAHMARYDAPVGRVQIVLSDQDDSPNGFASPLPYPLVHLRAAAPAGDDSLGNLEGWLRLVLTHELAHVIHLNQGGGVVGVGRKIFGRAPFLFPNTLTPTWMIEGLATYEETEGTAFGRGRSSDTRMLRRMAALADRFPGEDRPVAGLDAWPGGQAEYLFGEGFLRDLSVRFGDDTLPALARTHGRRLVPFLDEWTSKSVTGRSFHTRWREWQAHERHGFAAEAAHVEARGLTSSRALTARGIQQRAPRFSPDGTLLAYTSVTLARFPAIRLMRPDGTHDRRLVDRSGGRGLSFTPDGRTLIYDEPEVEHLFALRGGLRAVDVSSGRVRWIARGVRASDPDVAPGGTRLVYVERQPDRSELAFIDLDGKNRQVLTQSAPETQWSAPRFSPDGRQIVVARWLPGGWLDLVLVDAEDGTIRELLHDRARDVEPSFAPDGETIVFRSDRDGVSNLYALRLADSRLVRLTNVLGGAFDPAPSPDGRTLAFASYSARGYDVHVMDLKLADAPEAEPFEDHFPAARALPEPTTVESRPYNPLLTLWPRFWSPYVEGDEDDSRVGAATGGLDVLFRHAWGLALFRGTETERYGARGFYQFDRLRPTFLLTFADTTEPTQRFGLSRDQIVTVSASLPLTRAVRRQSSLSLGWRFERQAYVDLPAANASDLGGLELAWTFSSAKRYPYSISPTDGWWLRLAGLREDPALGSDVALTKLYGEARIYQRAFGDSDVLALKGGGGTTVGRPTLLSAYSVGGFPDGGAFDVVGTNFAVLRGYPNDIERGRHFAHASVEYRVPLFYPQRGWRTLPVFLRRLHATAFADAAHAWSESFEWRDVRRGAGLALGADLNVGHGLPVTGSVGVARGFDAGGETRGYFRLGLSF
jgi:WD40-like Beta Propeller Repeat/Omp85 superfamily domain